MTAEEFRAVRSDLDLSGDRDEPDPVVDLLKALLKSRAVRRYSGVAIEAESTTKSEYPLSRPPVRSPATPALPAPDQESLADRLGLATTIRTMSSPSHSASRTIIATPRAIFRAFVDPEVLVKWRAPTGMEAELLAFDPRLGGGYKMALRYVDTKGTAKSTADADIVLARFVELEAEERIVEAINFESTEPTLGGTMRLTTTMKPVTGGTKVTFLAEEVPSGINEEDHVAGMESALKNLANLLE